MSETITSISRNGGRKGLKRVALAAIALTALSVGNAQAATINFVGAANSGGDMNNGVVGSYDWVRGSNRGIEATASALTQNPADKPLVYLDASGLLGTDASTGGNPQNLDIDNASNLNEGLSIVFNQAVRVTSIVLARWDSDDAAVFSATQTRSPDVSGTTASFYFDQLVNAGAVFELRTVDGGAGVGTANFRLASIEVQAVPLPAAGYLLLSALGGLFAMRRRRAA